MVPANRIGSAATRDEVCQENEITRSTRLARAHPFLESR